MRMPPYEEPLSDFCRTCGNEPCRCCHCRERFIPLRRYLGLWLCAHCTKLRYSVRG